MCHFLRFKCFPMTGSTHLSTWISIEAKQRFAAVAARQSLSESAPLKRLVEQMLASAAINDVAEPVALLRSTKCPHDG